MVRIHLAALLGGAFVVSAGCTSPSVVRSLDAGPSDGVTVDADSAGALDAGSFDAGSLDAASVDAPIPSAEGSGDAGAPTYQPCTRPRT
jgi:hypothetical protein